jgi:hypothetical protein
MRTEFTRGAGEERRLDPSNENALVHLGDYWLLPALAGRGTAGLTKLGNFTIVMNFSSSSLRLRVYDLIGGAPK